jgi:hypothetical protein
VKACKYSRLSIVRTEAKAENLSSIYKNYIDLLGRDWVMRNEFYKFKIVRYVDSQPLSHVIMKFRNKVDNS